MAFPLPCFDDDDSDHAEESSIIKDLPVENPFCAHSEHTFTKLTSRNLKYDSSHPVYSTASCHVFIARNSIEPPTFYALKCSSFVRRIRSEYDIYQLIGNHPTILSCFDTWVQKGVAFLQLELAPLGSIRHNLFSFSFEQIWKIFAHITYALYRLHSIEHMHLDISPSNILQCSPSQFHLLLFQPHLPPQPQEQKDHHDPKDVVYKLADFGTTLHFGSFDEDCEGAGPYVSPEALAYPQGAFKVGAPTDIFSFGVVMFELVTKKLAPRASQGYQSLRDGSYDLSGLPREFSFIAKMLDPNPSERPTAEELLKMPKAQKEIKLLTAKKMKVNQNTQTGATVSTTPMVPTNKLTPETPYTTKYTNRGRKIIFDDEDC